MKFWPQGQLETETECPVLLWIEEGKLGAIDRLKVDLPPPRPGCSESLCPLFGADQRGKKDHWPQEMVDTACIQAMPEESMLDLGVRKNPQLPTSLLMLFEGRLSEVLGEFV